MKQLYIILFLYYVFHYVSSCKFMENKNRFECENAVEISVEGTEDWKNVYMYNYKKKINLRKDTFKKTPNINILAVGSLNNIEPGAFNGLDKLDKLVIFASDLQEVPPGALDNLPIRHLQIVDKIHSISPGFFQNLPDIRHVDIRNNSLGEIKTEIFNNTPIYKLYLDYNKIDNIEKGAFFGMELMVILSLTGNNLKTFDSELLLGDNNLLHLWLNRNQLTNITKSMLSPLVNVKKLFLEINQIEFIEDGAFSNMQELDFLDLSNNRLKELHPKIFPKSGMKLLYYFLIHNNQFTFINTALFVKTPKLRYISYGGNPFQCPCLDETKDWTDKNNITRLCDDVYFSGERPVCIFSDVVRNTCIYDVELMENLYEMYNEALKEYPQLHLKCDTSKGVDNAGLKN